MKLEIKRSNRKSISVKVLNENELLIKAPYFTSDKEIEKMLDDYSHKINYQIEIYRRNQVKKEEDVLYYIGKAYAYHVKIGKYNKVEIENDLIVITHTISTSYEKVYDTFLKKETYRIVDEILDFYLPIFKNLNKPTLKVKCLKSKWGSCAFLKNEITINSVLVMCPIENIKEVVVHELCHFYHHNHSKAFHDLLESIYPNHRKVERELKDPPWHADHEKYSFKSAACVMHFVPHIFQSILHM